MSNGQITTLEAATAAWETYAEEFGPALEEMLAEYETMKQELFTYYNSMISLQNEALQTREQLIESIGENINRREILFPLPVAIPSERKEINEHPRTREYEFFEEAGYYKVNGRGDVPGLTTTVSVVDYRLAVGTPDF